jgi:hypothetical protein
MIKIKDEEVAKTIAQTTSDLALITDLMADDREWVRASLNVNPALDAQNRSILSTDASRIVRTLAAASTMTPVDILAKLGSDRDWRVRYMIGYNKDLDTLKQLYKYAYRSSWPFESILERLLEIYENKQLSPTDRVDVVAFILDCYSKFSRYNEDADLQIKYRYKIKEICENSSPEKID